MNIDYSKIISEKCKHNYSSMATDSVIPFHNNMNRLLTESHDIIKKYLPDICKNPLGIPFVKYYSITENMNGDDISSLLENITQEDDMSYLTKIMEYKNSMDWLHRDTLYKFALKEYSSTCLYEASCMNELTMIGYNINTSPEAIDRYAKLLARIETDDYYTIEQSFPQLLKTNTNIILGLHITLSGQVANLIVSMPITIVKRMIRDGNRKQQKAFIKIINNNISDVSNYINSGDAQHYNLLMGYLDNLEYAKSELERHISNTLKESAMYEHIAQMIPNVPMYEDGIIEDPVAELDEILANITFDLSDEISNESLTKIARLANQINNEYVVVEGKHLVRKAATSAASKSQKLASKIASAKVEANKTNVAIKKVPEPFVAAIDKYISDLQKMDKEERRERIVTGEFTLKLKKQLKRLMKIILAPAVVASIPGITTKAIAIIAIIVSIIVDKKTDDKTRRELIRELESELAVVNEKLEDSRGDNNKQQKYQLIRLKKKLEADLERVKYNLKSS